jgi:FKBP-type peptidyl-prolyl cis-trans isomerase 2
VSELTIHAQLARQPRLRLEGDDDGEVIDASDGEDGEPIDYVHGYGMLVPGLEAALVGLHAGDEREVVVPAEAGYGERDETLVLEVERSEFPDPKKVEEGDEFVAESPDGDEIAMRHRGEGGRRRSSTPTTRSPARRSTTR